jgi:glutaredoxin
LDRFEGMQTQVLGLSVDSSDCLRAWGESLGGITYPLLSDFYPHGRVAQSYGVLRPEGYSERAIFIVDKKGIIRYVDVHNFDEQPDNDELFSILAELEPQSALTLGIKPAMEVKSSVLTRPASGVVLYCTAWCPDCRRARLFFKEHDIEFVEVDITHDRAAAAKVREWARGFETTPTFDINGTIIVNFDRPHIKEVLRIKD